MAAKKGDQDRESRRSDSRWGKLVIAQGFIILPATLFIGQRRLGLSANEFNIILQIISFWWDESRHPYPNRQTLALRMGVSVKTVQRNLASLENKGLVRRITRIDPKHGRQANAYDLSGLVKALGPIASENSQIKVRRQKLDRPKV